MFIQMEIIFILTLDPDAVMRTGDLIVLQVDFNLEVAVHDLGGHML